MDELLTTRQVAETLKVSESSVKRWCDQGLIRTLRTAGGHRRVERASVLEFLSSTGGKFPADLRAGDGSSDAERVGSGNGDKHSAAEIRRQFQEALISGDERRSRQLLIQWRSHMKDLAELGDEFIAETFDQIGQLWECGRVEVFEERRGCEVCSRLLMELRSTIASPPMGAPRAIGGALEGDHYTLATQLVELVLREAGWNATNLGGNLPFGSLLRAVEQERPKMLWLSVSTIGDPAKFVEDYRQFYDALPKDLVVAIGGRALSEEVRRKIKCTTHCGNLQQLAAFAQAIYGVR